MTEPEHLSREERALFNPAYMALVTCRAVQGHQKQHGPCPLPIALIAAVMALQPSIRQMLPSSTSATLPKWIEDHREIRSLMKTNTPALAAVVRPGVLLALQTGVLALDESARLTLRPRAIPAAVAGTGSYLEVQRTARWLGRWLPGGGSTPTVLTLLGVRL